MIERILVGTDGSGTAAAAVAHAVDLAKATNAEVVVVSAYPSPAEPAPPFTGTPGPSGVDVATGLLEDVEKRYASAVKLRTLAREGNAADVLIDTAEAEGIDLIIVGNRGMSGAKRLVLGSVPNTVSHHAPCNVLIVHTTEE